MITQHNPTENRPSKELKRLARACLLGRYPVPIAAMLAAWFLPGVLLAPFSAGLTAQWNPSAVIYLLATGIIGLLGQLLTVNVTRIHILLGRKQKTSYQDLLRAFRNRPDRYLLAALLMGAMLLVPLVPVGAAAYLLLKDSSAGTWILTAVILAAIAAELYLIFTYGLIYPIYLDHPQMPVLEGFRTSRMLMKGNRKRRFVLQLSLIGWQALGMCSAGIGFLWIQPYLTQTVVNFYLDLTDGFEQKEPNIDDSRDAASVYG